ncbi:hypothetical protein G5714_012333 [Onychostoma macrolepis]|uniref:Uncharacterized protein n=1 Tax=Onychostoma macrolepis TaxID=369639 RepID=A0A7J6CIC0_9TELE|nr:hypothetical protein G5714_012333 [Onychostoma macrolepis]
MMLVVGCFRLKDVHHRALQGFQVVLVSWQGWMSVECLRHTGTLGRTAERERGRRQVQIELEEAALNFRDQTLLRDRCKFTTRTSGAELAPL